MDSNSRDLSYWLGRRPGYQGPRLLSGNQGRGDKFAIGRSARSAAGQPGCLQFRKQVRVGTWNVRSLMQLGKLNMFEHEMVRLKVHVCGIAEVRWKGQGHCTTAEGHTVIYSGE